MKKKQVIKITILLIGILNLHWPIYYLLFVVFGIQKLVPVEGPDGKIHHVCAALTYKVGGMITEMFYSSMAFLLPLIIIGYNIVLIIQALLGQKKEAKASYGRTLVKKIKQRQLKLAIVMACSVVEFLLFQIPLNVVVFLTIIEAKQNTFALKSSTSAICLILIYFEYIINPVWITFIPSISAL